MPSLVGEQTWGMEITDEGQRNYTLKSLVVGDVTDGPLTIANCPGLPLIGDYWQYGSDIDVWAFRTPYCKITQVQENEPNIFWQVEHKFSTAPRARCQDFPVENPLLAPDRVGGTFVKYTRQDPTDKNGKPILNSSKQLIRGPIVEFDKSNANVWIEQNVTDLQLPLVTQYMDRVNSVPMWGLSPRMVKLSGFNWSRVLFGSCFYFFVRTFEFDIDFNTFDR